MKEVGLNSGHDTCEPEDLYVGKSQSIFTLLRRSQPVSSPELKHYIERKEESRRNKRGASRINTDHLHSCQFFPSRSLQASQDTFSKCLQVGTAVQDKPLESHRKMALWRRFALEKTWCTQFCYERESRKKREGTNVFFRGKHDSYKEDGLKQYDDNTLAGPYVWTIKDFIFPKTASFTTKHCSSRLSDWAQHFKRWEVVKRCFERWGIDLPLRCWTTLNLWIQIRLNHMNC